MAGFFSMERLRSAGTWEKTLVLLLSTLGVYVTFLTNGVLHERMATERYGEEKEVLPDLTIVTTAMSVGSAVVAALLLALWGSLNSKDPKVAPLLAWAPPALTHSIGPPLGSLALKYIPYSAQVLVKSSKMVPVMLMNLVWNGHRYSFQEYLCTGLIAGGVALFSRSTSAKVAAKITSYNPVVGYLMVGTNLLLDGWTSAFQDGIRHKYPHTSPLHIMLGMNSLVAIFTIAAQSAVQVLARVPFLPALRWTPLTVSLAFFRRHPKALWHLALVTGTGVAGQLFIFLLIAIFGTLTCSTVTTTRKFFSILASVIVNQNPLTRHQWMGVFGVFSGISLKTYSKAFASKPKAADEIVKPAAAVASAGPRTGGIKSENGISKDGVSNGANGVGSKKDS